MRDIWLVLSAAAILLGVFAIAFIGGCLMVLIASARLGWQFLREQLDNRRDALPDGQRRWRQ